MANPTTNDGLGKILVTGDVVVDWLEAVGPADAVDGVACSPPANPPAQRASDNWHLYRRVIRDAMPGGAMLLAEMIRQSTGAEVVGPQFLAGDYRRLGPEDIVLSEAVLKAVPRGYVISAYKGYSGPCGGDIPRCLSLGNSVLEYPTDAAGTRLVVIDDPGNGFRHQDGLWPDGITDQLVVYKMHHPLAEGKHWDRASALDPERLVVVVLADDLRRSESVHISRSVSWERTAADFAWQIMLNPALKKLNKCAYLVVQFGAEGAILHRGMEGGRNTLIFNTTVPEGAYRGPGEGCLYGRTAAFTAALTGELLRTGIDGLEDGIQRGLESVWRLQHLTFQVQSGRITFPVGKAFAPLDDEKKSGKPPVMATEIPFPGSLTSPDPGFWRILDQRTRNTSMLVAEGLVVEGRLEALSGVPVGQFGKLRTIDRSEIESYSCIRNLIAEFLADPKTGRPLSIAVFGAPGSGKSFGVTEVANTVGKVARIDFNLSQFRGPEDLDAAFHQVRDVALEGAVPFVFFDEFDSALDGEPLGWLRLFLAPMQDGKFREGQAEHPIGKAIFVFAGGTSHSYARFARTDVGPEGQEGFQLAKGPDFLSRLRGFIDIMGPNRAGENDSAYVIRRALVLRGLLERMSKARDLFARPDEKKKGALSIDEGVLRALLGVPKYLHGIRSMEAILDMSMLAGRKRFEPSALPPREQLDVHVDGEAFLFLVAKERFTACPKGEQELLGKLAPAIHESYLRQRRAEGHAEPGPAFGECSRDVRNSNLDAAGDIPRKLRLIGCGVRPIPPGRAPATPDITDCEVEDLARLEHERYCQERILQGWTPGPRDPQARTTPYLVDFDQLPKDVQDYDRKAVLDIPFGLAQCGWEVFRMQETADLADSRMIDGLTRAIHDDYVAQRKAKGETVETNSSLVTFDDLHPDIQQSNADSALAIPAKLLRVGYGIRRLRKGRRPSVTAFFPDEIEVMARMEHERWNWQRRIQGWTYKAGSKDEKNKTTPYLLPYDQLEEKIKEYDRETIRLIPALLEKAGFEAYKLRP
jgi:hypothetical protein